MIIKIFGYFTAMKIAISARTLKHSPADGISRFTGEVVKRLISRYPEHRFILIFDKSPDPGLVFPENTSAEVIKPAARHPVLWYAWHEWQLPGVLKRTGADIFLSPDGIISLRSDVPAISVIHDISFFHRPKDVPPITSIYYRHFFMKFAERAKRIITVSEFCRGDIASNLKTDPEKIDVAWNGVSPYFSNPGEEITKKYRHDLTGGVPYFLFVSNFSPRKNIPGLIKGYNLFRERSGMNCKLVLTGGRLFLNSETDRLIRSSPWSKDIITTGPIRHEDLNIHYSSALALVFVPWFEGFGIPAAEAMRCGVPAILSGRTSLPEIGGDAALYADPGNPDDISGAMIKVAGDEELRSSMSKSGYEQSLKFSWDNTARSVWNSVEKAAGI
jgi:glycosyltransferase involved in cell wall biosynthesis